MERMGMPTDNISLPEEMIDILKKSIKYFFYKDIESYKKLYLEIEKYLRERKSEKTSEKCQEESWQRNLIRNFSVLSIKTCEKNQNYNEK